MFVCVCVCVYVCVFVLLSILKILTLLQCSTSVIFNSIQIV